PVYGYGMMLSRVPALAGAFAAEAAEIEAAGFTAMKMKVGLGVREDIGLVEAVRGALADRTRLMVDANHAYHTADAFAVGHALEGLGVYWFEEPVAPEDLDGYAELRARLRVNISGGEAEFTRWGWRPLLERRCLDIAQPEVCALGGISEYMKVLALAHTHFTPVINHVWGSAVSVATNMQLLAAMPPLPGAMHPDEPMLEFDTTHNAFRDELALEPFDIAGEVRSTGGRARVPARPGHGITPNPDVLARYAVPR
ncbi:MAG: mandelate racemase/muconate lactonizing enzyme family protein, partial [Pseudomonadota bacterium]